MQKCHIISANVTIKQYWRRNFISLSLPNCKSEFKLCVVFVCGLLTSVLPSIFLGLVILLITSTHGHKKKCKNFRPAFGLANCKNEAKLCLMFVRFWLPCPPGSLLPSRHSGSYEENTPALQVLDMHLLWIDGGCAEPVLGGTFPFFRINDTVLP